MKASDIIAALQNVIEDKGDVDIYIKDNGVKELVEGVQYTTEGDTETILLVSVTQ